MVTLGIDPGKAIGLCLYDGDTGTVLEATVCTAAEVSEHLHRLLPRAAAIGIERVRAYGLAGKSIADGIEQTGWLISRCGGGALPAKDYGDGRAFWSRQVFTFERRAVLRALSHEVGSDVRKDAGVWAALVTIHGEGCDKKGGKLYGTKAHARAALAVAWALSQDLIALPF